MYTGASFPFQFVSSMVGRIGTEMKHSGKLDGRDWSGCASGHPLSESSARGFMQLAGASTVWRSCCFRGLWDAGKMHKTQGDCQDRRGGVVSYSNQGCYGSAVGTEQRTVATQAVEVKEYETPSSTDLEQRYPVFINGGDRCDNEGHGGGRNADWKRPTRALKVTQISDKMWLVRLP